MKIIPTWFHGILDYVVGLALIFAPNIFGFAQYGGSSVAIPRILGIAILLLALMTNYEFGLFKTISMKTHLTIDYVASLFLLLSPWLFGFADLPKNAWAPHVAVGILLLLATIMTEVVPFKRPMGVVKHS